MANYLPILLALSSQIAFAQRNRSNLRGAAPHPAIDGDGARPCEDGQLFRLDLKSDGRPCETSWILQEIFAGEGPDDEPTYAYVDGYEGDYYDDADSLTTRSFCLGGGSYEFTILDARGDGISPGYYLLSLDGEVLAGGVNFGYEESTAFSVAESESSPAATSTAHEGASTAEEAAHDAASDPAEDAIPAAKTPTNSLPSIIHVTLSNKGAPSTVSSIESSAAATPSHSAPAGELTEPIMTSTTKSDDGIDQPASASAPLSSVDKYTEPITASTAKSDDRTDRPAPALASPPTADNPTEPSANSDDGVDGPASASASTAASGKLTEPLVARSADPDDGMDGPASASASSAQTWTELLREGFENDLGIFRAVRGQDKHITYYPFVKGRRGVVRLQNEQDGNGNVARPSLLSAGVVLDPMSDGTRLVFSFYANSMELHDGFCLDSSTDDGSTWHLERCWHAVDDFDNGRWYDDVSVTIDPSGRYNVPNTDRLRIGFRSKMDSLHDDILIDKVQLLSRVAAELKDAML